ncbi:sugar ABC transporter substrate-binding protein [Streptomyces sp. NBC_00878]|uniref:ABC transporter substrate-binding protein n=1 Tax=Streptomyces sp. NBC_00878 TaxID=2975854 RepID=UPI00224C7CEC|nr:sugar ABC transporter substrate-binding protein [Streptomyces sp. NBC_00878]MCX4905248.1 sugar ABC transporter substrate-binding protein [Streptomyces sp. NBC_00878]
MRTRRARAAGVLLTSVALFAAACGGSGSDTSGSDSGTITLWARDSQKAFINIVADTWNKDHDTKVKVTVVPQANFVQKFGTAAAGGSGPDVASIDLVYLPYFASTGVLDDITDLANDLPYKDDLSAAHRRLATYNDRTYALPFTAEASVLFYNKDLFRKAGLDPDKPPANYAEIISAAKKIRALGNGTYGYAIAGQCGGCQVFEFTPHIWASGGDVLSADGKKALFDTAEVTDALTFYRTLYTDGTMPAQSRTDTGTNQPAAFLSGKLGMTPLGAFFVQVLKQNDKIDFGVAPLPGKNGGSASFSGGDEIAVTKNAKNKEQAQEFVRWATGEQAQTVLAENSIVPVRTDLIDKIYTPLDPRNKVLADAMKEGRTPYSTVENALFNDSNGPWVRMINRAVFDGDIAQAQEEGQKAAQSIIDDAP